MTIVVTREQAGSFRHTVSIGSHLVHTDVPPPKGEGSAPGPHDYFDASLGACKALTLSLYAQQRGIPLEAVDVAVDRDSSQERQGHYRLAVRLTLHGALTPEQRDELLRVAGKCPVHKLMTEVEIDITTSLA
jgi:putative redox protein